MGLRGGITKRRRSGHRSSSSRGYESMMRTLLLQNQQIIIQQQNMMFMVMKQFHPDLPISTIQMDELASNQIQQQQPLHHNQTQQQAPQPQTHHHSHSQQQQQHHQHHHNHHNNSQHQHQQAQQQQQHSIQEPTRTVVHIEQQDQQRLAASLQDNLAGFMTPAASEQDPISETGKSEHGVSESDALSALLEGDALLTNNLLYNPCTDVGSITPYKNHHQTPSYYSSGCESLSTPRVEQQCQPVNISQNVVKNLNNSFKSPTKPQINVQILSGSATREMRKAKIIQSMNISEFLRQVHHDDAQKSATQ